MKLPCRDAKGRKGDSSVGFTEKDIAELRKVARLKKMYSIYQDYIYIYGERLEFTYQEIFASGLYMMLPNTYVNLPAQIAKIMYPSEYRPSVIKTSPSLSVNFSFTLFESKVKMNEVATCAREFRDILKKLYSNYRFMECTEHFMDDERQHVLAWYSFCHPTLTEPLYDIHAFMNIGGRLLQCMFSTTKDRFAEWKPYALEAFDSISSKPERGGELKCKQNKL